MSAKPSAKGYKLKVTLATARRTQWTIVTKCTEQWSLMEEPPPINEQLYAGLLSAGIVNLDVGTLFPKDGQDE